MPSSRRAAADRAVREKAWTGPLHGVPMMHKDMYYQAGKLSTCGSALRKDWRPAVTATVIERLRAAGAYTFGGLNMAEFAQNPTGHNQHVRRLPQSVEPAVHHRRIVVRLRRVGGGAVQLHGAGIGYRRLDPPAGLGVRRDRDQADADTRLALRRHAAVVHADNVGPLTRTARDCARVLTLIAGHDPHDPTSSHEPVPDYEAALDGDVRGLRIGLPSNWFLENADAPVLAAMEHAVAVLVARGATVQPIDAAADGCCRRPMAASSRASRRRPSMRNGCASEPQDYGTHISGRMYGGYAIPATYYIEALSRRGPVLKAFAKEVFAKVDVLISPTIRTCLPTLADTDIDHGPPGTETTFMAVSADYAAVQLPRPAGDQRDLRLRSERLPDRLADRRRGRSPRRAC